jgi:hypothetical protein
LVQICGLNVVQVDDLEEVNSYHQNKGALMISLCSWKMDLAWNVFTWVSSQLLELYMPSTAQKG